MIPRDTDKLFSGSIPQLYEQHLVPLIFAPYAADLAQRIVARAPSDLLEIAAGTGVLTRELADRLPDTRILASDLNPPMLEHAAAVGTSRPVQWQQADAMQLPFADGTFDAVACQFGAMFFPDKARAFAEARRVLRAGGVFIFNVWDDIAHNELADIVTTALGSLFPQDPPRFMARVPHGYHDPSTIAMDLRDGGFSRSCEITTLPMRSRAPSAREAAIAYCQGTPLRNEIEARSPSGLAAVTDAVETAIATRFGTGVIDSAIQALVVAVER